MVTARTTPIHKVTAGGVGEAAVDLVAVEEPLEIQLGYFDEVRRMRTLMVTMRTPGHDRELAAGSLYSEGIVAGPAQIHTMLEGRNVIRLELTNATEVDWTRLERLSLANSSCGVCGKTSIERAHHSVALEKGPWVGASLLSGLPQRLWSAQNMFRATGGLHAAALFQSNGELLDLYEDVGRHNAVDKLIGSEFLKGRLPLRDRILLVSGRAGFEIVQKALAAGIAMMAAIGAPSSLAVDLARDAGMTLAGFVRDGRYNIYSVPERIQ